MRLCPTDGSDVVVELIAQDPEGLDGGLVIGERSGFIHAVSLWLGPAPLPRSVGVGLHGPILSP